MPRRVGPSKDLVYQLFGGSIAVVLVEGLTGVFLITRETYKNDLIMGLNMCFTFLPFYRETNPHTCMGPGAVRSRRRNTPNIL